MEHMFWRARVARMRGHSGHSGPSGRSRHGRLVSENACRAMPHESWPSRQRRHGWRCHVHFVHSVHFARWLSGFFRLHCGNACRHRIIRQVVAQAFAAHAVPLAVGVRAGAMLLVLLLVHAVSHGSRSPVDGGSWHTLQFWPFQDSMCRGDVQGKNPENDVAARHVLRNTRRAYLCNIFAGAMPLSQSFAF